MQPEAQAALRRVWLKQELARYQQRVQAQPDEVKTWRQLARASWELGEIESALAALDRVLALQPDDGEGLLGRIVACLALNRNEEGLAAAVRLLELFPNHPDALLHQIEALRRLNRWTGALAACEQALALPNLDAARWAAASITKAAALAAVGRNEESLAVVEAILTVMPDHWGARLHRAIVLLHSRRFAEALEGIEALIAAPETQFKASCVKAGALALLRRFAEADVVLDDLQSRYPLQALQAEFEPEQPAMLPDGLPQRYTARGLYLMAFVAAQERCDWSDRDWVVANIEDFIADALRYGFVAGIRPFCMLSLPIDPALQLAVARARATAVEAWMAPIRETVRIEWPTAPDNGRLRIGYVSSDFRNHPTSHLTRKMFRMHDRSRFEIVGFSLRVSDGSHYRQDIVASCDRFVELAGLSHVESAARIAQEGIHILVDMNGYTRFARPELFALRPAPLQVAFLGYPGSLGANFIPYIIADPVVLPDELRPFFSEQPIMLDCYQINDDEQPIAETGLTRAAAGLPEADFVYCCFSASYKFEPGGFDLWMRILKRTPGSVLWLLAETSDCAENLRAAASARGVDPKRLVFAPNLPKAEHLERHRLADLFIDTFIYNAHTTASDALWAGLPVVACRGVTFQSRVCASLLNALGLEELIATDRQGYEDLAVALAVDRVRLQKLRERLVSHRETYPLFGTERFVRQLEQEFVALWDGVSCA